jgi:hypothetical protein
MLKSTVLIEMSRGTVLSLVLGLAVFSLGSCDYGPTNPCLSSASARLLISELGVQPAEAEFIEIWNSGSTTVDLSTFYLSDNAGYYLVTTGNDWVPSTATPGSDFLARFPPGTTLAPNAYLVVQAASGDFDTQFATCPDFAIGDDPTTCRGTLVPKMIAPTDGDLGTMEGTMLSNSNEMVMLFCWDGQTSTVADVDYVTWGTSYDDTNRVDKTSITGYLQDTPRASQNPAPVVNVSGDEIAIARCNATETGETPTGGNGGTGHDETSEQMVTTFKVQTTATPGMASSCN